MLFSKHPSLTLDILSQLSESAPLTEPSPPAKSDDPNSYCDHRHEPADRRDCLINRWTKKRQDHPKV